MPKNEAAVATILEDVDRAGDPVRMTQAEWKDFLEQLIADLEVRLEAVTEELSD